MVAKRTSKAGAGFRYLPRAVDDPVARQPNISLAKRLLDWKPVVCLGKGYIPLLLDLKPPRLETRESSST
jgi:nucleoside-diphosphate-sugar epimerase